MTCSYCGKPIGKGIGRPRLNIDDQKVLGVFQSTITAGRPKGNVAASAKLLKLPRGTVWGRLAELGVIKGRACQ